MGGREESKWREIPGTHSAFLVGIRQAPLLLFASDGRFKSFYEPFKEGSVQGFFLSGRAVEFFFLGHWICFGFGLADSRRSGEPLGVPSGFGPSRRDLLRLKRRARGDRETVDTVDVFWRSRPRRDLCCVILDR